MNEIGQREFSQADQNAFSKLSGDANPIHVDAVTARRTIFGGCIVHGVHLVLWALECWLRRRSDKGALAALEARFLRGLELGAPVVCRVQKDDGREFALELIQGDLVLVKVLGRYGGRFADEIVLPEMGPEISCNVRTFVELPGAAGDLELFLNRALFQEMFPDLTGQLPDGQVAAILATTRLVGMVCPGLHSIYSGFKLRFEVPLGGSRLSWRVDRAEEHLPLVSIEVLAPGMTGILQTIFRPRPPVQASFEEVSQQVANGEFTGQRALIIGGSRGLGEVVAKIVASGGGCVCLTYFIGEADAHRLCAELRRAGAESSAIGFDAVSGELPPLPWTPTHLYYFATSRITANKAVAFSPQKFASYCDCHISGFARTVLRVIAMNNDALRVFYPSTIFLDEAAPGFAEYCAAKAAGEALCRQLAHRFPSVIFHAPRLPRMATDQAAGLLPLVAANPLDIMLSELRAFDAM